MLENIQDFNVMDFNCLFSDAHCVLTLTLLLKHYSQPANVSKENSVPEQLIFWQPDKSEIFEEKFDIVLVSEIETKLDNLIETDCITENSINEIVGDIDSLFESCSKASFGTKTVKKHNKYSNFKPWFNRACINARNAYHKTRKLYNRYKTKYHKKQSKMYK